MTYLSRNALAGLSVAEVRGDVAAAVAGRMLGALGAEVVQVRLPGAMPSESDDGLDIGKAGDDNLGRAVADADVVLLAGDYLDLERDRLLPPDLRRMAPRALLGYVTPFGLSGPQRAWRGGELVAFHASGLARLLIGPVPDLEAFPPVKADGDQAAFAGGMTLAAAVATALAGGQSPGVMDVSVQEALASVAVHELARPSVGEPMTARSGDAARGNATVMLLPCADGVAAVSPREPAQWDRWTEMMGNPAWALEPGMRNVAHRQQRYDAIYPEVAAFTARWKLADLFRESQASHVPCFPLQPPGNLLDDAGLAERGFFTRTSHAGREVRVPSSPYGLLSDEPAASLPSRPPRAPLPLAGIRVLDFSWVIAGPTCTRFLSAMGAEVIKVEAPGRPDPARASVLHAVLGQGKRSLALDLKSPEGRDLALRLAAESDVVIENFAAGVMDRLGLGWEALAGLNPRLIYASLSGMGRSGPDAEMVAYGTLLQAYSGFSALNGFAGRQPTIGWAWTDPVCALVLTTAIAAGLQQREGTGRGCRIDASMAETMLWTMGGAIIHQQVHGEPPGREGNADPRYFPHDVYRARGDDAWLAIAARDDREWAALCSRIPELAEFAALDLDGRMGNGREIDAAITAWAALRAPGEGAAVLQDAGVSAAASASAAELLASEHLGQRGFFAASMAGERPARLAAIPWRLDAERGRPLDPAGPLGSDTDAVLLEFFGYDAAAVQALRAAGVVA